MRVLMFCVVILGVSGCATVISGSSQNVHFDTVQGGGHITIYWSPLYGKVALYDGPLPVSLELERRKIYKFDVSKEGYETQTIRMKPGYNALEALSVPSPTFFAIDGLTGAGREFPEKVIVDLENVLNSTAKGEG